MRSLFIAASCSVLSCAPSCDSDTFQRMETQKKNLPYGENPLFEDGRAMRPLPEGVVPRERLRALAVPEGGSLDAGYLNRIPVRLTPELLARGQKRFDITCAACHGLLGDGDSPVAKNMSLRPPPALLDFTDKPDGWLYDVITNGWGLMPPYADQIPVEDRWAVVAYVRALQRSQRSPLSAAPEAIRQKLQEERR